MIVMIEFLLLIKLNFVKIISSYYIYKCRLKLLQIVDQNPKLSEEKIKHLSNMLK